MRRYYGKEIISLSASGSGAVQRELEKLVASGLVLTSKEGRQRYYSANPNSIIFSEIQGIVVKTFGLLDPVRDALKPFGKKIVLAFIFGSVARGEDTSKSDIDLLIVARGVRYTDLMGRLIKTEKIVGRPVNPTLYSPEEFAAKIKNENHFVRRVIRQPRILVVGTDDEIDALAEPSKGRKPQD